MPETLNGVAAAACGAQVLRVDGGPRSFRALVTTPESGAKGYCLFIPSGQVGSFDAPGQENELYDLTRRQLANEGIGCMQPEMPLRESPERPASEEHRRLRTARVTSLVKACLGLAGGTRFTLCGISLGARNVLDLLADPPRGAPDPAAVFLIGCVLESPVIVMSGVARIRLIYGGSDHIAYVSGEPSELAPIPPEVYGPQSAGRLVVRPRQQCQAEVWYDLRHTLGPRQLGAPQDATASRLAGLIGQAFDGGSRKGLE